MQTSVHLLYIRYQTLSRDMDHHNIYVKGHRTIEIVSSFPAKQRMLQEDNPNAS